jgi:hypothetical protein
MSNSALSAPVDFSGWEPKFPFDLVVAYEDADTRNRALHLYDHLAQQLLDDYDFQCSWWKFDHLTNDALCEQATDAALDANMVILSLHARRELAPAHKMWLERWIPRRPRRKSALVTLIAGVDRPERDAPSLFAYLQNAARLGHMDFFPHAFDLPKPPREWSAEELAERARVVTPFLQDILHQRIPVPRWGINE